MLHTSELAPPPEAPLHSIIGSRYRDKASGRVIEITARNQARETYSSPVAWTGTVVEHPTLPQAVGRVAHLSDRTLTRNYRLDADGTPAGGIEDRSGRFVTQGTA